MTAPGKDNVVRATADIAAPFGRMILVTTSPRCPAGESQLWPVGAQR
jgi:hypothetical protein